jgi:hypothetical protein
VDTATDPQKVSFDFLRLSEIRASPNRFPIAILLIRSIHTDKSMTRVKQSARKPPADPQSPRTHPPASPLIPFGTQAPPPASPLIDSESGASSPQPRFEDRRKKLLSGMSIDDILVDDDGGSEVLVEEGDVLSDDDSGANFLGSDDDALSLPDYDDLKDEEDMAAPAPVEGEQVLSNAENIKLYYTSLANDPTLTLDNVSTKANVKISEGMCLSLAHLEQLFELFSNIDNQIDFFQSILNKRLEELRVRELDILLRFVRGLGLNVNNKGKKSVKIDNLTKFIYTLPSRLNEPDERVQPVSFIKVCSITNLF